MFAPLLAPYPPDATDLLNSLAPPSPQHWLGTNQVGQDTLSRLIYGVADQPDRAARRRRAVDAARHRASGCSRAGAAAGSTPALSRVLDIMFAFPGLLLAILAVALFGKGLVAPVIAMSIAYTPFVARLVRSLVIQARSRPYVAAYRVQGFGPVHIAVRRLLPNVVPDRPGAVDAELRLRAARPRRAVLPRPRRPAADAGLGRDDQRGPRRGPRRASRCRRVAPALAIVVVVVAFNIVGEELADRIAGRDR